MPNVNVVLMDFPNGGNEMITLNEDDSYTILINARLSHEAQIKAYEHALKHIREHDFEKSSVQEIEVAAHQDLQKEKNIQTKTQPSSEFLKLRESKLKEIKKRRPRLQRLMKKDQERVDFLMNHCDLFDREEHRKLYGDDL